jgi:hypothetical protein
MMMTHPLLCLLNGVGIVDVHLSELGCITRGREQGSDTMDQFTPDSESISPMLTGNRVIDIDTEGGER